MPNLTFFSVIKMSCFQQDSLMVHSPSCAQNTLTVLRVTLEQGVPRRSSRLDAPSFFFNCYLLDLTDSAFLLFFYCSLWFLSAFENVNFWISCLNLIHIFYSFSCQRSQIFFSTLKLELPGQLFN